MKKIQISPSILSADFSQLGIEIKRLEEGGADMIHVDVMDGHFVPNLTIGPTVIKALKKKCSIKFDVHLMISPVHKYIESYADAGADIITIHPEATDNLEASIQKIKELKSNHSANNTYKSFPTSITTSITPPLNITPYPDPSIVPSSAMTFEVLFDDGHQSIPVERFEILGDAIACYVNCILNAKEGMNAIEIVDDYFETIASHSFLDLIGNENTHSQ